MTGQIGSPRAREFKARDLSEEYDGLIFDCDGTLTDSMPLHFVAWVETMKAYGIVFTEDRFYSMAGMPSDGIIRVLAAEQDAVVDVNEAAAKKELAFERMIDRLSRKPDVCDVARDHYGRLPMAVASGGIRPIIQRQLTQIGMLGIFDAIVTAEDTERHKPEPDVFLLAAKLLGVQAERCLVFEDSPLGFTAAELAGMDWIDVRAS